MNRKQFTPSTPYFIGKGHSITVYIDPIKFLVKK